MLPTRRSQNWLPGIFNDFFGNEWMEKSTSPAINIIENDKEYKVELAAPGLTKEDFNVRVTEENQLVVTMEKNRNRKMNSKMVAICVVNFSYSKYQQTLLLPDNVNRTKITASVQHGA